MKDTLSYWMQRDDLAKQRAATQMREVMPDASQEEEQTGGVIVERLFDESTRDEEIKLYANPTDINDIEDITDSDWCQTPIGEMCVSGINIIPAKKRSDERYGITVYFKQDVAELLQYRRGDYRLFPIRSREIPLNADGIGWDELGKKDEFGEKVETDRFGPKPDNWQKWFIVDIGRPITQMSDIPQLQAAAD